MSTFAIVNLRGGERRDVEPFLLDNDSFPLLQNAYLFRGRVQRRSCFRALGSDGRLKGTVGTTDGSGDFTLLDGTISGGIPSGIATFEIAGDTLTDPGGASPVSLLTTGSTTGILDRATGVLDTNALNEDVTYIPGLPVMGLATWEKPASGVTEPPINDEELIAFDTRYSYLFDRGANEFTLIDNFRATPANKFIWTGTNSDFFWTTNYFKAFWATNNVEGFHAAQDASPVAEKDGIRWYADDAGGTGWSNFNPPINAAGNSFLNGCLILLSFKNRLIAFNTLEGANLAGTTRFPQRARWCQIGTPFYSASPSGTGTNASGWDSETPGRGGFTDAPTEEVIVGAEFLKDILIVYFERSTWQLVYTYNRTQPFVWQKISSDFGCESTFSVIPFDSATLAVGNFGITSCDSINSQRIDQKIPDEVFQIQNKNNGVKRVYGIRDYNAQLVYWTYPLFSGDLVASPSYELTYPNNLLVYNYLDKSWSEFTDTFTCFGYFQNLTDLTWADLDKPGQDEWENSNYAWNSQVFQSRYPDVIAGNQRGFVMIFSQLQNLGQNTPSLPIANISGSTITCPSHNLTNGSYILITGALGGTGVNDEIFQVTEATVDTFVLDQGTFTGTYTGEGLITVLPNFYIQTKQFNPFFQDGKSLDATYLDVFAEREDEGEITAQVYTSINTSQNVNSFTMELGPETNFQSNQNKIWHRIYLNSYGSFIQNIFTLSDAQMRDLTTSSANVIIHGLMYYVRPTGRISYEY